MCGRSLLQLIESLKYRDRMVNRMKLLGKVGSLVAVAAAFGLWILSGPESTISAPELASFQADVERGERIFHIGGCASCHMPPDYEGQAFEEAEAVPPLSGGRRFETEFGTFIAPNITPDKETGIGGWSTADFATALLKGVSPDGRHYYPAFPYTSYARMELQDLVDLKAYMDRLPAVARANEDHELAFPFSIRRGLGFWKIRYLHDQPIIEWADHNPEFQRGRYLVEGPGHCGECHSPRDPFGGIVRSNWLGGAASPDGEGSIPNITPHKSGIAEWEAGDIVEYLSSGFTPDFDVVGSAMAEVVNNTAKLSDSDRKAIAVYLKSIPAVASDKGD
jgi:mono/diheme cytochrome c family protein